jgi:hypothetical protein
MPQEQLTEPKAIQMYPNGPIACSASSASWAALPIAMQRDRVTSDPSPVSYASSRCAKCW